jgi:hypothetical protein
LPGALKFFGGFQVPGLSALISADSYLSFVSNSLITFMIVFQIPLLMIIFDRIKPISPKKLLAMEKYVVLAGLLVALIVPFAFDVVTCLLIAAPIVILYNVSVAIIIVRHARRAAWAKRHPVVTTKKELSIDDQLLAEFFADKEEEALVTIPSRQFVHASRNNEFKPKAPSAEEVRRQAMERRQQEIAAKVARYNQPIQVISQAR